jgi:DNA-directed RNA polymerase subunit beta
VSENALRDLDESGIIRIGATGQAGRHPRRQGHAEGRDAADAGGEAARAIFGEKAGDVRDASLKCPPGIEGTVVDVKIFSRKGIDKDLRALAIEQDQIAKIEKNSRDEIRIIREEANKKIRTCSSNAWPPRTSRTATEARSSRRARSSRPRRSPRLTAQQLKRLKLKDEEIADEIQIILRRQDSQIEVRNRVNAERIELLQKGDELPPGVIKMVKVYVAMKRKLSSATRWPDGTATRASSRASSRRPTCRTCRTARPIEIVLNPLGRSVPNERRARFLEDPPRVGRQDARACPWRRRCSTAPRGRDQEAPEGRRTCRTRARRCSTTA